MKSEARNVSINVISPQGSSTPRSNPSGISLLLAKQRESQGASGCSSETSHPSTPKPRIQSSSSIQTAFQRSSQTTPSPPSFKNSPPLSSKTLPKEIPPITPVNGPSPTESTPLLNNTDLERGQRQRPSFSSSLRSWSWPEQPPVNEVAMKSKLSLATKRFHSLLTREALSDVSAIALRSIPAVLLGSLLNILDGVSCACSLPHLLFSLIW